MFNNFKMILAETTTAVEQVKQPGMLENLLPIIMLVAMLVVLYFVMIRPNNKRKKEEQKMRDSLRVFDEITTIGGIKARILNIKDDTLVIETLEGKTKMSIKKWALQSVDTVRDKEDLDDEFEDEFDDIDE